MATKEEILDSIASMSVLELSELLKDFEEKFGVTAAAPVAVAAAPAGGGGGEAAAEEQQPDEEQHVVRPNRDVFDAHRDESPHDLGPALTDPERPIGSNDAPKNSAILSGECDETKRPHIRPTVAPTDAPWVQALSFSEPSLCSASSPDC